MFLPLYCQKIRFFRHVRYILTLKIYKLCTHFLPIRKDKYFSFRIANANLFIQITNCKLFLQHERKNVNIKRKHFSFIFPMKEKEIFFGVISRSLKKFNNNDYLSNVLSFTSIELTIQQFAIQKSVCKISNFYNKYYFILFFTKPLYNEKKNNSVILHTRARTHTNIYINYTIIIS